MAVEKNKSNKKIYFGDDGEIVDKPPSQPLSKSKKRPEKHHQDGQNLETKWYQVYEEYNTNEFNDIKDSELKVLQQLCQSSFNDEVQKLIKSEPADYFA